MRLSFAMPAGFELVISQQLNEAVARAIDTALDRADRASADLRRFFVGEASAPTKHQCFALIRRQRSECGFEIRHIEMAILLRLYGERILILVVRIVDFAAKLAVLREVDVPQNREEPGTEVGAWGERIPAVPRLDQRFLHETVGALWVVRERPRKRAQMRDGADESFFRISGPGHGSSCPSFPALFGLLELIEKLEEFIWDGSP